MVFWGLVLARGLSESIPDKNIRTLSNKPLIGWVLEPMKSSAGNVFRVDFKTLNLLNFENK
jgi:CMP-N-acetylneuraminic acid synthetase